MSRETILSSLIHFDASIPDLKSGLGSLTWDSDPVVTLARRDIVAVLERFSTGEIDALAVEDWANLVECREDIGFESGYEDVIHAAIHDLANPVLSGELRVLAPGILAGLR
ncbi:hypothetical protein [Bradyrhizobium sp. UFLA05-112]